MKNSENNYVSQDNNMQLRSHSNTHFKTIINKSFCEEKFLTEWKCATVVPFLKKSNLERTFRNYRSLSNLFFTSKLLEKTALDQLIPHLESIK